jgi:citrate/tricarballylate utilization protein
MQSNEEALKEAERVMTICNACRYCEGFCAVFPAMELRRTFSSEDLKYLSNLCHNCRGCYYACQYAPPHEFSLNVPKALGELRVETYKEWCWPSMFAGLFSRNAFSVAVITLLSLFILSFFTFLGKGSAEFFGVHTGEGAFYQVIPYPAMVLSMSALGVFAILALFNEFLNLWRAIGGTPREFLNFQGNKKALWDALRLKYLDGGGHGCNYPDERFSMVRRWFHHGVFYGFMSAFAATTIAMIYEHFFHLRAPYPFWSLPVVLGTLGGVGMLTGTGGLLYLKKQMDRAPSVPSSLGMDVTFLILLFLTNLSGLLLLVFRETSAMGLFLVVHLGLVAGLFISIPYSKFIHSIYRYAVLVRNAMEQARGHK